MTFSDNPVERGLGPDPSEVSRLAVVRPGGVAAVVQAIPALRHLRATFTDAQITVAASERAVELLEGGPLVDRIVPLEQPSELLIEQFDLGVLLATPSRVDEASGRLFDGVDCLAAAAYREPGEDASLRVHPVVSRHMGEVWRMLRLAWLLGGDTPQTAIALWPTLADRKAAEALMGPLVEPVVAVHWHSPADNVNVETWVLRVCELARSVGMRAVVVGASGEGSVPFGATDLRGKTSIRALAAVLERSALFVGPALGPAALAVAIGSDGVVFAPPELDSRDLPAPRMSVVWPPPAFGDGVPGAASIEMLLAEVSVRAQRARRSWDAATIA